MSLVAHSVSFSDQSDEINPPSSSSYALASSSSPSKRVSAQAGKLNLGPVPRLEPLIPLAPAKTVALTRRAVNFSPRTDTKYFHSDHSIIPSLTDPPPSIRSYHDSDNLACSSSPANSPSAGPQFGSSETPSVKSILKSRVVEIRVAASVEEGTLNNKEPARLVVTGKRPRMVARDSFQLAMLRKAASDGVAERDPAEDPTGKGKGRMTEDPLGSDDSVESEESRLADDQRSNASSEEEEEVEESGELSLESLVRVILDPPEELLSLEEAYNILSIRLRHRFSTTTLNPISSPASTESIRLATQPLRNEAPAMVRAMQRDILRLLGKVQHGDTFDSSSTPFRDLKPLGDSASGNRSQFTPSPSVTPTGKSPIKAARQGYTEAEVRYRREASGVGSAALKFLAFVFASPHLWDCFTEADLLTLIDKIILVLRTPRLPTPNQKRTYYTVVNLLAQIRLPVACIAPVKEKIARTLEMVFSDGCGSPGATAIKDMAQVKREAYHAIIHLVNTYPALFFAEYASLLPICLRGMLSPSMMLRSKASAAAAAFVAAKLNLLYARSSADEWNKNRMTVQRCEAFVVSHLKSLARAPGRAATVYNSAGEKRTEWLELQRVFKETVGAANGVAWACATWSVVMTLMGQAYETSTIASGPNGMNHIMERSLSMTTNGVRPLLASVAWCHAIYSYLLSNSTASLNEKNEILHSYSPWVSTPANDWQSRLETVLMPVEFALQKATEPRSFTTELVEKKWRWRRPEEAKQLRWMVTTAQVATSIVFAYTGTALHHVDQPAKEMTMISGLPSSDGPSVPGDGVEDAKLERLDKVWERVARPLIKRLTSVCGVDNLNLHGWAILEAILRPEEPDRKSTWSLDRLCSARYLSGEVFATEKEMSIPDLRSNLESDIIQPSEIPAWGSAWIVSRLDKVLDLFQEVLGSMTGISGPITKWEGNARERQLIPATLSRIWYCIIHALAQSRHDDSTSEAYSRGLGLLLRHLLQIFNRDPASHAPLSRLNEDAKTIDHADVFRLDLFSHLLNITIDHLGDDIGAIHFEAGQGTVDQFIASQAFGANGDGHATMAGSILGQLLRSPHQVMVLPLDNDARHALESVVGRLLGLGTKGELRTKLLGDMTNVLPFMFEQQEEIRLDMWRLIASHWVTIDVQPAALTSSTNHTGELLISLLSCPFRASRVDSAWHQRASVNDLNVWQNLLRTVVMRFRAKKVGSNLGVLENLAGHLRDFLERDEKTSRRSTTITLSCLASALSWLTFVPTEAHHADHYSINENYVPVDFLAIVSNSLLDSYPSAESQPSLGESYTISPGVTTLFKTFGDVLSSIPAEFVMPVLDASRPGIIAWMTDEYRIVSADLNVTLDNLYIALLTAVLNAIASSALPASSDSLHHLLEFYGPRLSRAQTAAVPKAFQEFWHAFSGVHAGDLSEDVRSFAEQILSAVPDMITVPGLAAPASLSEDESQLRYPHALEVRGPVRADDDTDMNDALDVLIDATEMEIDPLMLVPEPTAAYDADISQLETQQLPAQPNSTGRGRLTTVTSPPTKSSSRLRSFASVARESVPPEVVHNLEVPSSMAAESGGDVFGPTGQPASGAARPRRRRKTRNAQSASRSQSQSSAPITGADQIPPTLHEVVDTAEEPLVPSSASQAVGEQATEVQVAPEQAAESDILVDTTIDHGDEVPVTGLEPIVDDLVPTQVPLNDTPNSARARPSLMASAKGWLARVPSFGLFSPTERRMPDRSEPAVALEDSQGPYDTVAVPSVVLSKPPKRRAKGKDKAQSQQQQSTSRLPTCTPRRTIVIEIDVSDDEDELRLSPASARKRKREEDQDIEEVVKSGRRRQRRRSKQSATVSRSSSSTRSVSVKSERGTPKGSTSGSLPVQPSPTQRSTQQERLLAMLDEAAAARQVVDGLDFDGVVALMRNVDALRVAAQTNLEKRAEEARAQRRRR